MLLLNFKTNRVQLICKCKRRAGPVGAAQVDNAIPYEEYYLQPIGPVYVYANARITQPELPLTENVHPSKIGTMNLTYELSLRQFERLKGGLFNGYSEHPTVGSITGEVRLKPTQGGYTLKTYANEDHVKVVIAFTKVPLLNGHHENRFNFWFNWLKE